MNRGDERPKRSPDEQVPEELSESRPESEDQHSPSDSQLLEAAFRKDIDAFATLFERHRQALYSLCLKRLEDSSLAEDAVQDIFIRAFTSLPRFDLSKPLWPWLATIAHRTCIDLQRRRSFIHYSENIGISVDADEHRNGIENETGSGLAEVIASEERAELWKTIGVLSKRQRRAFLLYAVDGWSIADIASIEGTSVGAVKLLLFRARRKMRSARQKGNLGVLVLLPTWLRSKVQDSADRIRLLLSIHGEAWQAACVQAVCLGALATMVVAVGQSAGSLETDDPTRFAEYVASPARSDSLQTSLLQTTLSNGVAPAKASAEPHRSAPEPISSLADNVINPNQNATPETTWFNSIVVSPNYQSDHTILAAGGHSNAVSGTTKVLFVSNDGGASWKPRASRFLDGSILVLPPSFPQDRRIFTFGGNYGLHVSDDGGEIFRMVSPITGQGIAISPLFGSEDSKILMGNGSVFEFDAATGITQPFLPATPLALGGGGVSHIAYSPNYLSDSTVFISKGGIPLYRCSGLICDNTQIPWSLKFRFSPCDHQGTAYAFFPWKLLVTYGGARTFGEVPFPLEFQGFSTLTHITDMAIWCNSSSDPALFASVTWYPVPSSGSLTGIYRSLDAGRSWSKTSIDLPGFDLGARKLIVTPTGRLVATGMKRDIACSVDLGETWRPRCTPEQ